jgi:hypothetical protein
MFPSRRPIHRAGERRPPRKERFLAVTARFPAVRAAPPTGRTRRIRIGVHRLAARTSFLALGVHRFASATPALV